MKFYSVKRLQVLLFLFMVLGFVARAQENSIKDLNTLKVELQNQFQKANIDIPVIDFERTNNAGIHLVLITSKDPHYKQFGKNVHDAFHVKATDHSLQILSASVTGLQNGIFWYLFHLGFRYYFPNEIWHYKPKVTTIYKPVEKFVSPSFLYRRIWYAYGTGSNKADQDYSFWFKANLQGGEQVNAGHAYDGIVNRNKDEFLQHPEYFAQPVSKGTIPGNPKFEVSNEGLVQLCVKDAFQQIEKTIAKEGKPPSMISMDPSDGGGFSTRPAALHIDKPNEQVFYLANRVAKAIAQKYPQVKIGLYAYNFHSEPPSFDLEPNIVVLIATSMNRSKYRTEELIKLWAGKNITIGIRDYYGVMAWDWDMPGRPKGSRLSYIEKLKYYYNEELRLFSAETNIGWISRGLGHYMATRLLWDVSANTKQIRKEFLKQMFGSAASYMDKLFQEWEGYKQPVPFDGDLYEWYQLINQATATEKSPLVQLRLNQIKQYLHYVTLFKRWKNSASDKNLIELLNYAYRIQDSGNVASYPLFRRLANSAVVGKPKMNFKEKDALWKQNNRPVTAEETDKDFYKDLTSFDVTAKTIKTIYPESFPVKVNRGNTQGQMSPTHQQIELSPVVRFRGVHKVVIHIEGNGKPFLHTYSGLIKANTYKNLILRIYPYRVDLSIENDQVLLERTITPSKELQPVSLSALRPGSYIVVIDDAKAGFALSFSGPVRFGIVADDQQPALTFGRNNLVFAVDQGIEAFYLMNKGVVTLVSPTGRIIDLQNKQGRIAVQVLKGEQGVWKMRKQSGPFSLQGVLPLVSATATSLL